MRRHLLPIPLALTAASIPVSASATCSAPRATANDACVAAGCIGSYLGTGWQACGFVSAGYRCGQTFTPAFGSVLREIRVGLWSQTPDVAVVEIRPTVGGMPTGTVLAAAPVPGPPYPGDRLVVADFATQLIVLEAGVYLRDHVP